MCAQLPPCTNKSICITTEAARAKQRKNALHSLAARTTRHNGTSSPVKSLLPCIFLCITTHTHPHTHGDSKIFPPGVFSCVACFCSGGQRSVGQAGRVGRVAVETETLFISISRTRLLCTRGSLPRPALGSIMQLHVHSIKLFKVVCMYVRFCLISSLFANHSFCSSSAVSQRKGAASHWGTYLWLVVHILTNLPAPYRVRANVNC